MLSKVVMLMFLINADGTNSIGTVEFSDYDSCYKSLHREVRADYVYVDRVCMDAALFDKAVLIPKAPRTGGLKITEKKEWF
jgi:hypothetical protein